MDNVTHSLTGLALARAGLNRWGTGATAVLILSTNIPDIDIVAAFGGALRYLEMHRGYTHSLIGLPFMAAFSVIAACGILRRRLPFRRMFLLACIGVASHLLLDWTNSYGIRLLLPFSPRWFHLDWNVLTDYVFLALLVFAAIWPYFGRLVSGEIGAKRSGGRGVAWLALVLVGVLEVVRFMQHARAVAQLNTALYDGEPAVNVSVLPMPLNPFVWRSLIETQSDYQIGQLNLLTSTEPQNVENFLKLPRDGAIQAVRQTEAFRFFEYFARFPVWSEQPGSTSGPKTTRVEMADLQFGRPGGGSFHCIGLVDASSRVLESIFTFGDGAKLGWPGNATMKQK